MREPHGYAVRAYLLSQVRLSYIAVHPSLAQTMYRCLSCIVKEIAQRMACPVCGKLFLLRLNA